jgi:hypothetical protein
MLSVNAVSDDGKAQAKTCLKQHRKQIKEGLVQSSDAGVGKHFF